MLAAASIGAIWSSTSPDFGINVSSLSACAEQCPRLAWGWWVQVADGFCSLQPCCHLLAQPDTPELFQLAFTADLQLGHLSGFSCSLLGYFHMHSMILVGFHYIKCKNEQQCSRVVCLLPKSCPRLSHTPISTLQFLCQVLPSFAACQGELSTTLVGLFHRALYASSEEFHTNVTNLINSF